MPVSWKNHIISTADVLHGKARLKGTRIPASLILGYLTAGYTFHKIIEEFPELDKNHISACLDYAYDLAKFRLAA